VWPEAGRQAYKRAVSASGFLLWNWGNTAARSSTPNPIHPRPDPEPTTTSPTVLPHLHQQQDTNLPSLPQCSNSFCTPYEAYFDCMYSSHMPCPASTLQRTPHRAVRLCPLSQGSVAAPHLALPCHQLPTTERPRIVIIRHLAGAEDKGERQHGHSLQAVCAK